MFCVKCGREGQTYESLCSQCFLQCNRFTTVPEFLDLPICVHCDDYQLGKKWIEYQEVEEAVKDFTATQVSVRKDVQLMDMGIEVKRMDPRNFQVHVDTIVRYQDLEVAESMDTTVRIHRGVCPKCNKIQGNYFESIIQVRPSGRKFLDEEKEEILKRISNMVDAAAKESNDAFISKVTMEHGGFDLYVSTIGLGKSLARDLVSTYGAEYKESSSLQGQKDGRDIYRVTYLVRLPPHRVRDIVKIQDRYYLVHSMGPQSAKLRDLKSNEMFTVPNSDLREVRVVGTKDDVQDAVVLTEGDREFEIMHPITFKTVVIKKPHGFKRRGDTVKVFPYEGELFLIGS